MTGEPARVRQMWHLLEPLHAVLYYAPEAFDEAAALGYDIEERWASYFAWRVAPLGAVGAEEVVRTFHSFAPVMVERHVPGIWATAAPDAVLAARLRAVDRSYRALFGGRVEGSEFAEAAALARRAAEAAGPGAIGGLGPANSGLPWPDAPHLVLWQAATVLREHRGDGHIAALAGAGLDPVESLVSFAAVGAAPAEVFASRGGARRSGVRPGGGSRTAGCWRRTARPRARGANCARRWSCVPTRRPPRRGGRWGSRGASGWRNCWGSPGWRSSDRGCCRPRTLSASGRCDPGGRSRPGRRALMCDALMRGGVDVPRC